MSWILLLLAIGVIAFLVYWLIDRREAGEIEVPETPVENMMDKQTRVQTENLRRVQTLFDTKGKVTNDDVQKLMDVSAATAADYLEELERQGVIRQVGETGSDVHYVKAKE